MLVKDKLINYFKASFPAIIINTTEEIRASGDVLAATKAVNRKIASWTATKGLEIIEKDGVKKIDSTQDPVDAFKYLEKKEANDMIFLMKDLHEWPFGKDPILSRSLRDFLHNAPAKGCCMVIISPNFQPIASVEKLMTMLEYSLPSKAELEKICKGIAESAGKEFPITEELLTALGGLSTSEAENALALSVIETKKFDSSIIYREKVLQVKKTGLLEIIDPDPLGLDAIGGLENLKEWITIRKRAYTPEAEKYGLKPPKGILLVGAPGSGKSLSAKAFGTALGVPTVRLDIGNLFNSLVGESEARTRDALKLAEAMAPAVLWIDEIDKGFAGSGGSGSGDSGVSRRVFGSVISWMQERKRPVFMVATANQVNHLPPELLRKGRFDEIFAVDLPNQLERTEIFKIHLKKRSRNPEAFDLEQLAKVSDGFTGSEIEVAIDEAMFNSFALDREVSSQDIMTACSTTVPLSVTAREQIDAIRSWAQNRARFASKKIEESTIKVGRKLT